MKQGARRRIIALVLPLPIMAAAWGIHRLGWVSPSIGIVFRFPEVVWWHLLSLLGFRSMTWAYVLAAGNWYLLLALGGYGVLRGRDRTSTALVACLLATVVLMTALAVYLEMRR